VGWSGTGVLTAEVRPYPVVISIGRHLAFLQG